MTDLISRDRIYDGMSQAEFDQGGVIIRRGWRVLTTAGRVTIVGVRLSLLNSRGVTIDSTVLSRARARAPWYIPKGYLLLRMESVLYLLQPRDGRSQALVDTLRGAGARS
ncbi:hypothetical protein ABZ695_34170 [Streptomyces sp. NPDC006976]|uniref:hypothetical protein n=1 Tax=Streptomyces sp. NPDC006976 TaxID=3154311 RepID=UPI0033CBA47F